MSLSALKEPLRIDVACCSGSAWPIDKSYDRQADTRVQQRVIRGCAGEQRRRRSLLCALLLSRSTGGRAKNDVGCEDNVCASVV